ncbi:hypothetical protein FB567DRAFT_94262 [Paraphoma chrysanthemicola]|uniref:DUF7703 domain-containing protein n=1 Tax=Paraphoma chrysanthemicola TaxID=798071 RepID=A0A8K0R1Z2_9PLEO|nr:hypothetical protein FB567DRAFT_94262 [Paraphoma chrysanthemicola]
MVKEEDVGIVGGVNVGLPILMTMVAFLSIGLYNVIELTFLIFAIFKRRKGLYFWSLLVATWGIVPHALGFVFKFFEVLSIPTISSAIVGLGWPCMVTGQSLVLYSRLHLVAQHQRTLRWVLGMIVFNAITIHIPVIALALTSEATQSARIIRVFMIFDKVQLVVFFVQEAIISIIYIYETIRLLGNGDQPNGRPLRKLLGHLLLVNAVVLILDATLVVTQFTGYYLIQTTYKTAVYSVKLKIEFSVLNRLVQIVKSKRGGPDCLSSNSIALRTWTSSKIAQFGPSKGDQSFTRMDDNDSSIQDKKGSIAEPSVRIIEEECYPQHPHEAHNVESDPTASRRVRQDLEAPALRPLEPIYRQ